MHVGGFSAIELVDNGDGIMVPDIAPDVLSDLKRFQTHETISGLWHFEKNIHHATFVKRPNFNAKTIFELACSTVAAWDFVRKNVSALSFTYVEAKDRGPAQLTWLQTNGYRVVRACAADAAPAPATDPIVAVLPQHALCGYDGIVLAVPNPDPTLDYYEADW